MPLTAQFEDARSGGVLGWRAGGAWAGVEEEPGLARPEVPHCRAQRGRRPAGPRSGLGDRQSFVQVGAQCLVAAVVGAGGSGEELPTGPRGDLLGGWFRCSCHAAQSNTSRIGHATAPGLTSESFADQGLGSCHRGSAHASSFLQPRCWTARSPQSQRSPELPTVLALLCSKDFTRTPDMTHRPQQGSRHPARESALAGPVIPATARADGRPCAGRGHVGSGPR